MKRYCFLLLFAFAIQPAKAQVSFGVLGGLNFAELGDIDTSSGQNTYDNASGYHIGVFADLSGGPIALRIGLRYLDAGQLFDQEGDGGIFGAQDNFDVNFVTVPIDLRFRASTPFVQPYFFLGPEFRFLTDTDNDDLNSLSMAGNAGVGLQLSLGGISLLPEFRYSFGLSGLMNEDDTIGGITLEEDQDVRLFMLSLGVGF